MPRKASRPRTSPPADQGAWGIGILADAPASPGRRGTAPCSAQYVSEPFTNTVAVIDLHDDGVVSGPR
jgi:hypothetical protein